MCPVVLTCDRTSTGDRCDCPMKGDGADLSLPRQALGIGPWDSAKFGAGCYVTIVSSFRSHQSWRLQLG